jgi:hypothetical protein
LPNEIYKENFLFEKIRTFAPNSQLIKGLHDSGFTGRTNAAQGAEGNKRVIKILKPSAKSFKRLPLRQLIGLK